MTKTKFIVKLKYNKIWRNAKGYVLYEIEGSALCLSICAGKAPDVLEKLLEKFGGGAIRMKILDLHKRGKRMGKWRDEGFMFIWGTLLKLFGYWVDYFYVGTETTTLKWTRHVDTGQILKNTEDTRDTCVRHVSDTIWLHDRSVRAT